MTDSPGSDRCQRWRDGEHSWRHRSEGGFDKRQYDVALLPRDNDVKPFVVRHHYIGTYPSAKYRVGLFHRNQLVGVAVYSSPTNVRTLTNSFPSLTPYAESVELGRFVLLDEVPANAETWFLAHSFKLITLQGVKGVVSFADPYPRVDEHGNRVSPGHVGTIYQAANGYHACQRGYARPLMIGRDGRSANPRALQKIRAQECGHEYAEKQLVAAGARTPRAGEDMRAWLKQALVDAGYRRVQHPGNFRYLFKLGTKTERSRTVITMAPAPYPKGALSA